MSTESLLSTMLKHDFFHGHEQKVSGIAQLAVDNGFNTLSIAQKNVLAPFFRRQCAGVTNPGDHHNDCEKILTEDELENAITNEAYYGELLCQDCINENEDYKREWDDLLSQ
ncbi:hypothetical protein [Proteus terrae]|uniref:hypothetical protein n=1 Tax=Proteus terrae TaxID=1574161 RepID=UPI00298D2822|nr:hypothetical protein [Proteus terrae]WPD00375.1 hypothetical protein R5P25_07655 [Proteus terrae]